MDPKHAEFVAKLQALLAEYDANMEIVEVGDDYYPKVKMELSFYSNFGEYTFTQIDHDSSDIEPS